MENIFKMIGSVIQTIADKFKKADSKETVKETKEALIGVNALSCFLIKRFKDGVGVDDFAAAMDTLKNDTEFKAKLTAAVEGANKIPAEIKDCDLGEGLELAAVQVEMVPAIIEAAKKN